MVDEDGLVFVRRVMLLVVGRLHCTPRTGPARSENTQWLRVSGCDRLGSSLGQGAGCAPAAQLSVSSVGTSVAIEKILF